jgi:L-lysine exporter family protein LysE/ArgO
MILANHSLYFGSSWAYGRSMLSAALAGLAFGSSLIVSIGPQNSYVLQEGAVGRHVVTVVAICLLSDVVLIVAGTAGAGGLVGDDASVLTIARLVGAAFVLGYAGFTLQRARRPRGSLLAEGDAPGSPANRRGAVASTALAFTWLNPWVYLDTVVLLGSVADTYLGGRWWFACGAMLASTLWFTGLGAAAKAIRPWFRRPRAAQVVDAFVGLVMVGTAVRLLIGT